MPAVPVSPNSLTHALLATRFFVPPLPAAWLPRLRLLERLQAATEVPVTLVSASPGFGKSSMVSEWIHSQPGLRVSWLSLEASDNEWGRFFRYLVGAWQRLVPQAGEDALAELNFSAPQDHEGQLNVLLNDLATGDAAGPSAPAVLVLDDYHCIKATEIHEAVQYLVEHLPPACHLILITRSDPPLPLARWRSRGQVLELRTDQLRFTSAETAEYLNCAVRLGLSDEQLQLLDGRTEGWIAGLQMAAVSLAGSKDPKGFVRAFGGSHRHVLDYLVEEVLSQQPAQVQEFLLATSLVDRFCGPLSDAMLERREADSQATLLELERANLFLIALDDHRTWFRFHHLLADLLRLRLQQTAPDSIPVLYRRAARWLAENCLWHEAIQCAERARDFELVAALFERAICTDRFDFLFSGLRSLIDPIPLEVVQDKPALLLGKAAQMTEASQLTGVEALLHTAEAMLAASPGSANHGVLLGMVYVVQSIAASLSGDSPRIVESSTQVSRLLPDDARARVTALIQLGNVHFYAGNLDGSDSDWQAALTTSTESGYTFGILCCLDNLGRLCCHKGELHRAEAFFQRSLRLLQDPGESSPRWLGATQRDYADLLCERNDLTAARELLDTAMPLVEKWDMASGRGLAYLHMGRVLLAEGDAAGAHAMLDRADELCERHTIYPDLETNLEIFRAQLLLESGNVSGAEAVLEKALGSPHGRHELHREWLQIAEAGLALRRGEPARAVSLLSGRMKDAAARGRGRNWLHMGLLVALAHHAQGSRERALDTLAVALRFGVSQAFLGLFLREGEPMRALLLEFLTHAHDSTLVEYAGRLLDAFSPTATGGQAEPWNASLVEPLSARELEVLRLLCDGLSNREMAGELVLSVGTVKSHIHNIFRKLGVRDRPQAIAAAARLGFTSHR